MKAAGFESLGMVNIEHIQRYNPEWVNQLKMDHFRSDHPDYWQTLLKQISTM
jgi:hypothetical protein